MEDEELIRRNMERTRKRLSEKVETLERRLADSIQEGTEAVKNALDIQAHFERHPWLLLGGALLGGYVVASMMAAGPRKPAPVEAAPALPAPALLQGNGNTAGPTEQSSEGKQTWLNALAPEIDHLKRLAVGVALGTVREVIASEAPPEMGEHLRAILDGVTEKVGGDVLPSSDWLTTPQSASGSQEGTNGVKGGLDLNTPRW